MLRGVLAALIAAADPDRHHYCLVHAEEDALYDWHPDGMELQILQHNLHVTCHRISKDGWVAVTMNTGTGYTADFLQAESGQVT